MEATSRRQPTDGEHALQRARELFERKAWVDSYRLLEGVDRHTPLEPDDLERIGAAAYLMRREPESEAFLTRAHQVFLERGNPEGAARCATWLAFSLLMRGAMAPASGWFARAHRILDEAQLDCVIRGYLLIPSAIQQVGQGDAAAGHAIFSQAFEVARRFDDRNLKSLAQAGRGRALIQMGNVREGLSLLDEAMVAVIAGDVTPIIAGDVYCMVLEGCQDTFDLRRAYEWTASLTEWCAAQSGLVRYRGECLLYRAEVLQLRGKWNDAARDAQDASDLLRDRPAGGAAFYRVGEIHRLRGEFAQAEAAYARAHEHGRRPQPGLSLLRLAQGQIEAAAASVRGALLDTRARAARARMLTAAVEILLAAGDLEAARAAAAELREIAAVIGAPLLEAASAHGTGAVLLKDGDIPGASASLRQAADAWRHLEMPYEGAHTCLLMAAVCDRRGDEDGRRLELGAARKLFTQLEAEHCLALLPNQSGGAAPQPAGPLSDREAQVLRLLATGKTNREIAEALFISDKTVARHVSNIFDKIGVSSRSAATAWAYQHHLA
jgi:DNA-binding CsgD family transcriptional regulator